MHDLRLMTDINGSVVVVGGGLAGLCVAANLRRRGVRPILLEASSRLGGRLCTIDKQVWQADLGARYVGDFHCETRALCDRLGISLVRRPVARHDWLPERTYLSGQRLAARQVRRLSREINDAVDAIVTAAMRDRINSTRQDVEDWLLTKRVHPHAVRLFSDLPRGAQSAWALGQLIQAAGGHSFFNSAETWMFARGARELVDALTKLVADCDVRTNHVVRRVNRVGDRFVLSATAGGTQASFRTSVVVLATPSQFVSELFPGTRARSFGTLTHNRQILALVRKKSRALEPAVAISDGPIRMASLRPLEGGDVGWEVEIVVRADSEGARLPAAGLVDEALRLLGSGYKPVDVPLEVRWARRRWIGGSYGSFAPGAAPSTLWNDTSLAAGLFAAGDLLEPSFAGYMEGAIRTARRSAALAFRRLRS